MDDRHAQFIIVVGDLCAAAHLAELNVELLTSTGGRASGVPASVRSATGEEAIDDTGLAKTFRLDDHVINFEDIISCTVSAPVPRARHEERV